VGQAIAHTLKQEDVPFVVIDSKYESIAKAEQDGFLFIEGDATADETLKEAGVVRASRLIAALGTDVDNTYVTLSARGLCSSILITARASSEEAEPKLKRAGADRVVSPHTIGGRRMAMVTMRPGVVDFIDTVTHTPGRELQMESIAVDAVSPLLGLTISALRQRSGATVLAVQKKTDELLPNPPPEYVIVDGDRVIVVGAKRDLSSLESVSVKRNHQS
jgi:voltage-gated potassium channel